MRQTSWLVIAAASFGLVAASACNQGRGGGQAAGPSYPMYSNPQMPGAQGSITAANDGNGNTELTIHVRNLAHPSRIVPNTTTYVVWVVPLQGQQQQMQPGMGNQPMQPGASGGMNPGQQGFVSGQPGANEQPNAQQQMPEQQPMQGQPMQGQPMQGQPMQGQSGDLFSQGLPPNAGQPMNVGVIRLDSHMTGSLRVKTPFSQLEVLITPESDPSLQRPTNAPVLVARVNRG